MSDLDRILARAQEWQGAPLAIATVSQTWGSAPRPRGSHMLVHQDGRFEGSVSGGCVEGEVLAAAAQTIDDGQFRQMRFGVADASAWEVGLPCGGEIEVLVQRVDAGGFDPSLFDAIEQARADGRALDIATDLDTGQSRTGACGGVTFVNHYRPPRRLLIVGAVQIAQSLVGYARELDLATTVIDPRGRFLTPERFPGVTLDDRWPDEAVAAARPDAATALVTLSHDPKIDDPALIAALNAPTGYIGALGSRRSHAKRLERLAAAGFDATALARIDGPAGVPIGALGPAEIALSVAAGAVRAFAAAETAPADNGPAATDRGIRQAERAALSSAAES